MPVNRAALKPIRVIISPRQHSVVRVRSSPPRSPPHSRRRVFKSAGCLAQRNMPMKKRQQQATATLHINDLGGSWDSAGTFGGYASEAQEEMAAIMQTMHNLSQEVKDLKDAKEQM